jgi:hypothetical protein
VLLIGKYQRRRGKIVVLNAPLAVLRTRGDGKSQEERGGKEVFIPVVDIINYKIIFNSRPEPVVYS